MSKFYIRIFLYQFYINFNMTIQVEKAAKPIVWKNISFKSLDSCVSLADSK